MRDYDSGAWPIPYPRGARILPRLKRLLRPLRPVLGPIWVRVRPFVEPDRPPPSKKKAPATRPTTPTRVDTWSGPPPRTDDPPAPIRVLTEAEFEAIAATSPTYYKGRRSYVSAAATIADDLIARHGLRSALELGPHLRPLIVGADVMDLTAQPDLQTDGKVIEHDATAVPWPAADDAYDLFVGLQVFEHLVGKQDIAFSEVRRIAKHAVISLPIDWTMKDPTNCHHQISNERALSWFAPTVPTRVVVGNPDPGKRLIYVFEDLTP